MNIRSIDDFQIMDLLDLNDYDPKSNKGKVYFISDRWVLQKLMDSFVEKENLKKLKKSLEKILISAKRKQNSIETGDERNLLATCSTILREWKRKKDIVAEIKRDNYLLNGLGWIIMKLLKRNVFEKRNGNWIKWKQSVKKKELHITFNN